MEKQLGEPAYWSLARALVSSGAYSEVADCTRQATPRGLGRPMAGQQGKAMGYQEGALISWPMGAMDSLRISTFFLD